MASRKSSFNQRVDEYPDARAAGWPELHTALQAGIPHAMEIVAALDAYGFSYPWAPTFCGAMVELRCYGIVHKAWREGMLSRLLSLLGVWRLPESQLSATARRPELQRALCEFLHANPQINLEALRCCLAEQSLLEMMPADEVTTVGMIQRRIETAWRAHGA